MGPEGTSWWAALVLLLQFLECVVQVDGWILPHLVVRAHF